MNIQLRALNADDASQYRSVRLNALRLAPSAFSSSFENSRELPDEFFVDRVTYLPDNFIVGAFDENKLIATVGGYVDQEKKRNHIGFVVGMWVEPDYRKYGIARKLVQAVVTQLKSLPRVSKIQLSVTSNNQPALKLYESFGFVIWGREPNALQFSGETYDEFHMALEGWT